MQVRFSLDYDLRREEFVQRAQLFPAVLTYDIEPHQLSESARLALALCNPDLPELYELLTPEADTGVEPDTGHLWRLRFNPNSYAVAEVVEIWAREYHAAQNANSVGDT